MRPVPSVRRHSPSFQEEGGYEYVSGDQGAENGKSEPRLESGVLYQPLGEAPSDPGANDEGAGSLGVVPLCNAGSAGLCAHDIRAVCNDDHKCHGGGSGHGHGGGGGSHGSSGCGGGAVGPEARFHVGIRDCNGGAPEEYPDIPGVGVDPSGPYPNPEIPAFEGDPVPVMG